jgi:hypothetical protein
VFDDAPENVDHLHRVIAQRGNEYPALTKSKMIEAPLYPSRGTEPDKTSGLLLPEAVLFCASVEFTLASGFFCAVCSAPHEVVTEKIAKVTRTAAAENLIIILLLSCCFRLLIGISRPTSSTAT